LLKDPNHYWEKNVLKAMLETLSLIANDGNFWFEDLEEMFKIIFDVAITIKYWIGVQGANASDKMMRWEPMNLKRNAEKSYLWRPILKYRKIDKLKTEI